MKKVYGFFVVVLLTIILTSCRQQYQEVVFKNVTLVEENTYKGYFEDNVIDLKQYIQYDDEYTIIFNEETFSSLDKTLFSVSSKYATFNVVANSTYRLELYKNETVQTEVIFPNNDVLIEYQRLGDYYTSLEDKIEEKATSLGYTFEGFVSYEFEEVKYDDVDLDDLVVLEGLKLYPILTPLENEVYIDGKKYIFTTGEIIDLSFLDKEGYTLIPFSNGFNTGNTYYKSMGDTFTTNYQPIEYTITLEYLGIEETINVEYDSEISLKELDIVGYKFNGWYYEDQLFDKTTYTIPHDIKLIANIIPNKYSLEFTNIDNPYKIETTYNEVFTLPAPTKEGYLFIGWDYNGSDFEEGKWTYLNDIVLVAKWIEKQEDVYLNLESFGGSVNANASVDAQGNIILPTPKNDNYNFIGWYYDSKLTSPATTIKSNEYNNEPLYAKYSYDDDEVVGEFVISRLNQHASDYSELVMFDKTKSGFTSKYWHKVGIVKSEEGYIVSAIATSGQSLSSLGEYDFIILAYTEYSEYNKFVLAKYQVGYRVFFSVDPTSLNEGETTLQVSFVAPNIEDDLEDIQNELSLLYKDIETLSDDIELINTIKNYTLIWKSSNKETITNEGSYIKPHITREVTLSAYIGETEVYSFTFNVLGEYENSTALSTGYIYTPYTITQNAMDSLDIIYTAFLEIDYKGDWTNLSRMKSNLNLYILPKAKISGTKVVVSINQKSSGNFSNVVKDEQLRTKLINNIMQFIIEMDIDGVDIDWETPDQDEAEYFTILMKELYEKVKAYDNSLLVTAAIGGGKWAPPCYDLPNSKKYMDYINLMTYSMAKSNGYYQNSLYKSSKGATLVSCSIEESIEIYNNLGVDNKQILLGIPFYCTMQTESGGPGSKTGVGKSVSYSVMLDEYPVSNTMIEYFDEECGVPYRYDKTTKVFFSYDNERSIKLKCDYINTLGLAGIMYWQYGQDVNDMLTNAIKEYINK